MSEKEKSHRIREIRVSRGMTQEDLGDAVGVSKRIISAIERGETKVTLELAWKIADALDVSLDDLSGRKWHREQLKEYTIALESIMDGKVKIAQMGDDGRLKIVIDSWSEMNDEGRDMLAQQAEMISTVKRADHDYKVESRLIFVDAYGDSSVFNADDVLKLAGGEQ